MTFHAFCEAQRKRLRRTLNGSVARVQNARKRSQRGLEDEWLARRPGSVGHVPGARKPTLDDYEDAAHD